MEMFQGLSLLHEYLIFYFLKKTVKPAHFCSLHLIMFFNWGENGACWTVSVSERWLDSPKTAHRWRTTTKLEQHSSVNGHLSTEMQLGAVFGRDWCHTQNIKATFCSIVASTFFYRQKVLGLRRILVSQLPHEASDCYYAAEWVNHIFFFFIIRVVAMHCTGHINNYHYYHKPVTSLSIG